MENSITSSWFVSNWSCQWLGLDAIQGEKGGLDRVAACNGEHCSSSSVLLGSTGYSNDNRKSLLKCHARARHNEHTILFPNGNKNPSHGEVLLRLTRADI